VDDQIFSALIPDANATTRTKIAETLRVFNERTLRFAAEQGIQVTPLRRGEPYAQAPPALVRLRIDIRPRRPDSSWLRNAPCMLGAVSYDDRPRVRGMLLTALSVTACISR